MFKKYQEKNKRKISQKEIEARSKNIDLLRKNLNLLQDEFKEQVARMRKDLTQANNNSTSTPDSSAGGKSDFINIFGNINRGSSNQDESYNAEEEDRELYDDEKDILKQFEANDKELENIAAVIVGALDELKGKA